MYAEHKSLVVLFVKLRLSPSGDESLEGAELNGRERG